MKQLTPIQNAIFRMGALLMLAGVSVNIFSPLASLAIYSIGAVAFSVMQLQAEYQGRDFTVRRLRRQQITACIFFLLAAVCMSMQVFQYGIARRNEWIVMLTIASVLQLYTSWRIPAALSKAKKS